MRTVVAIGTFDGIHIGHQKILSETCRLANKFRAEPLALTFAIPPRQFFNPSPEPFLLTTVEEKKYILKKFGMTQTVFLAFNQRFRMISPAAFFKKTIVKKYGAKAVVVGHNFCFGRNREGNPDVMKELGRSHAVKVCVVAPVRRGNVLVSSGRIRDFLKTGSIKEANSMLGYPFFLFGRVVAGKGLGRKLGFPTANIKVSTDKIAPSGVFAVRAAFFQKNLPLNYYGMCNVGFRPTLGEAIQKKSVEVHLIDFNGNLYGKILRLEFLWKIRAERKFGSLDELRKQLVNDRNQVVIRIKNQ